MSQVDYSIANQLMPAGRTDLNAHLAAIASLNSGATAPSTTFPYMLWADTANDLLKQRNAADSAWISLLVLSTGIGVISGATIKSRYEAEANAFTNTKNTKLTGIQSAAEVNPALVSLAEAQAGSAATERTWSSQRVRQAIQAAPAYVQAQVVLNTEDLSTGAGQALIHIPFARKLTAVHAEVATAGTTGVSTFDINRNGTTMLSTKLTIDSGETGSDTAVTAAVINTAQDDTAVNDVITIDIDGLSTTVPKGLVITMTFENS